MAFSTKELIRAGDGEDVTTARGQEPRFPEISLLGGDGAASAPVLCAS